MPFVRYARGAIGCLSLTRASWQTNVYFDDNKPWVLAKQDDEESTRRLAQILYTTSEALRIGLILLQPIIPTSSEKLLDGLGVAADKRTFEHLAFGAPGARPFARSTPVFPRFK
eukprot:m.156097 g.156097  ORF g.156097 m.156097 type:complete len:114 (-) comp10213_c0_seq3:2539-2880(-)